MLVNKIYENLPVPIQNLACSIQGARIRKHRYGKSFILALRELEARCELDQEEFEKYRVKCLRDYLKSAMGAPFWKKQFNQVGVDIEADNPFNEIRQLPIISKSTVQADLTQFLNTSISKNALVKLHTSGTTGSGLIFYTTRHADVEQWATWWRYRRWHGLELDEWCGYFGGREIVPVKQVGPPFYRVNRPGRQVMFSAYHLCPANAKGYVAALNKFRTKWLHGYPSVIALLAQYIREQGLVLEANPRIVTTGAESLLPFQRELIQTVFGCVVRQHYGMAEAVANISEGEDGVLRVDEDFSFIEFVPVEGQENTYRIIGTNWTNPAFPLIRYDTGDLASGISSVQSGVRLARAVESIDGRKEDFVTLPNGVRLGRLDHIFKDFVDIREAQIYQPVENTVIIRVVKGENYTKDTELQLLKEARLRIGQSVDIKFEYLDRIARTKSGKLRFVVSEVG